MVNYFDVLGLSIQEIDGRDEATIAQSVDAAHKKRYARTVGSYANVPRKDGRTQAQWQVILNEARDTLKDPQKRRQHIADLPETKKAVEQKKEANLAAVEQAVKKVLEPAVKFVVRRAEIISAIGIALVLLGGALIYLAAPIGRDTFDLGRTVLLVGLPAFLYNGSQRRIMVVGAAGIILMLLGYSLSSLLLPGPLLAQLGQTVVMCGLVSFLFKQSWHLKIMDVTRRVAAWWWAKTAGLKPMTRVGATGVVLGLTLSVFSLPLSLVFGGVVLGGLINLLFVGGIFLVAAQFLWYFLFIRPREFVECQGCGAKMTRKRFYRKYDGFWNGCPACGSDLVPVETGKRQPIFR